VTLVVADRREAHEVLAGLADGQDLDGPIALLEPVGGFVGVRPQRSAALISDALPSRMERTTGASERPVITSPS
jgi:hypothetical protein